jgi:hypothetical protein
MYSGRSARFLRMFTRRATATRKGYATRHADEVRGPAATGILCLVLSQNDVSR